MFYLSKIILRKIRTTWFSIRKVINNKGALFQDAFEEYVIFVDYFAAFFAALASAFFVTSNMIGVAMKIEA